MAKEFRGVIQLDVRDSKPDWEPFVEKRAPEGARNVLIVLFDDTGLAAWSPFGGRIEMPTLQRLSDNGLRYSQWHTTALCSPTRSCLLTGRNHHQNGFACISEASSGFPGSHAHLPDECAPMAKVLRSNGYSAFWVGKDHNVPEEDGAAGGSKKQWPLQQGFDRFYGFLGGETNQWYPSLTEDNRHIDQPYQPEDGYHLSKDLADKAIQMIRDNKASAPSRPWFLWFCPGANHAPHHVPKKWADKYKGKFDDGYDAYRAWALPRMIEKGILPAGTELTPLNPMPKGTFDQNDCVRPWDSLSAAEKKLFSRMAEVYAGFSESRRISSTSMPSGRRTPTTTTPPAGPRRSRRRSRCSSGIPTPAARAIRSSFIGPRASRPRERFGISTTMRSTSSRRSSSAAASNFRRPSRARRRRRSPASR